MAKALGTFDPTKPFGTISGTHSKQPSARYEQFGALFTIHHVCVQAAAGGVAKLTDEQLANLELEKRLNKQLNTLTGTLGKLSAKITEGTAAATEKVAFKKAKSSYDVIVKQLETLANSKG